MILQRLKQYIDSKNISTAAFEKSIGMSNASFGRSLKNNGAIGTDKLENILSVYHEINPDWLLTGNGPMLRENEVIKNTEVSNVIDSISIPLVDITAAAGTNGYDNPDYIETVDHIKFPDTMLNKNEKYLCIRIKGESMSPTLLDSTYVVIRLLNTGEWVDMPDRHIYVISDKEGRAYIKRLKNRLNNHGFVVCMSDNPDKCSYPNFNLAADEINSIWHAEWYFSAKMPNIHETYYNKVSELEDDMDLLKDQVSKIMKSISK